MGANPELEGAGVVVGALEEALPEASVEEGQAGESRRMADNIHCTVIIWLA